MDHPFGKILGGGYDETQAYAKVGLQNQLVKPRTFREQIQDQISYHESKIKYLNEVLISMTPDVEKFINAVGKL